MRASVYRRRRWQHCFILSCRADFLPPRATRGRRAWPVQRREALGPRSMGEHRSRKQRSRCRFAILVLIALDGGRGATSPMLAIHNPVGRENPHRRRQRHQSASTGNLADACRLRGRLHAGSGARRPRLQQIGRACSSRRSTWSSPTYQMPDLDGAMLGDAAPA